MTVLIKLRNSLVHALALGTHVVLLASGAVDPVDRLIEELGTLFHL